MIVALTPYLLVKLGLRSESTGKRRRRHHVVLQAERVADLVRDDLAHRLAHQLFGNVERSRHRVGRAGLDHQPVAIRPHVVVDTR